MSNRFWPASSKARSYTSSLPGDGRADRRLLRRAGHAAETVLLHDHPRDPDEFLVKTSSHDWMLQPSEHCDRRHESPNTRGMGRTDRGRLARETGLKVAHSPISHTILSRARLSSALLMDPQPPPGLSICTRSMMLHTDDAPCRRAVWSKPRSGRPHRTAPTALLTPVPASSYRLPADLGVLQSYGRSSSWPCFRVRWRPGADQLRKMPRTDLADLLMLCRMRDSPAGLCRSWGFHERSLSGRIGSASGLFC